MRLRRIRTSVFVCTFSLLLLLMDYPYLSRLYNDRISGDVIARWQKSEAEADCEKRLSRAREYNRSLSGDLNKEARVLCLEENGLAGWIRIGSLDLVLPLYIGTGDDALEEGAGILEGHSLPVGGEGTHACISAHRGLPDRTLFTNLDMLQNGDLIEVHTLGQTLCYEVFGSETVLPTDIKPLEVIPGKDLLTLITCTPYGINSHRLYVHAGRCAESAAREDGGEGVLTILKRLADPVFWKLWWWIPATILLLLIMIFSVRKHF